MGRLLINELGQRRPLAGAACNRLRDIARRLGAVGAVRPMSAIWIAAPLAVLALDAAVPLGVTEWALYLVVFLAGSRSVDRRGIVALAALCTMALFVGLAVSPAGAVGREVAVLSRTVGASVIWLILPLLLRRQKAEEEVERTARRLSALMNDLPGMVYRCRNDPSWTMELCSQGVREVTGYAAEDLVDNRNLAYGDLIHPEDRDAVWDTVQEAVQVRGPYQMTYRIRTADGEERWVWERGRGLFGPDGRIVALEGFVADITDRIAAERMLRESNQRLERTNAELQEFAYVASHDLQEPLRTVTSFSQLLAKRYRGQLDEDADDFVNLIAEAAQRMQQLIEALLAYSRVGTRGGPLVPADLEEVLGSVRERLAEKIAATGATLTQEPLPVVHADPPQLAEVFEQLLENALEFRSQAPPRIRITASRRGAEWIFSVRDNGIGIAAQYHDRIFRVFQRLHPRGRYGGCGIGLAVCKKIIERHGGRIWLDSEPGKGSTFHFSLPALR